MRTDQGLGRAVGRTRLYQLHQSRFDEMLRVIPLLGPRLVALMTDRVRETTHLADQREKLMALGKLSAGLAHELNNPAAAMRRAADALGERGERLPELTRALVSAGIEAPVPARAGVLLQSLAARDARTATALERGRAEQELGAWLDARGIGESWMLAEPLADAGVGVQDLEALAAGLPPAGIDAVVRWVAAVVAVQSLTRDIRAASVRISELVGSVKVYSHMDRGGDRQAIDLREGLDSTLVMFGHKLKRKQISLERDYAADAPRVSGFAGELNQVWTNLADNAIDAMSEGGVLRIEIERDGATALVRVIDDGPGIPPEIRARIFEAFFTTKPVGEGTGLGLDIAQRIVAQRHGGRIDVESRPGRTVFTVRLPMDSGP